MDTEIYHNCLQNHDVLSLTSYGCYTCIENRFSGKIHNLKYIIVQTMENFEEKLLHQNLEYLNK